MISVVIAARDEERRIGECLSSVAGWADEIVVVDDHSTDRTAAIAEAAGAHVIRLAEQPFDADETRGRPDLVFKAGFLAARGDWILRMDCDERPSNGLKDRLLDVAGGDHYVAVRSRAGTTTSATGCGTVAGSAASSSASSARTRGTARGRPSSTSTSRSTARCWSCRPRRTSAWRTWSTTT